MHRAVRWVVFALCRAFGYEKGPVQGQIRLLVVVLPVPLSLSLLGRTVLLVERVRVVASYLHRARPS